MSIETKPGNPDGSQQPRWDAVAEVAATLEAEYALDRAAPRDARAKEQRVSELFAAAKLEDKGRLEAFSCRQSICRGVVRIANEAADKEVFLRTLLSSDFALAIPDAVSVTSREKQSNGAILATFYLHSQEVFQMVSPSSMEN